MDSGNVATPTIEYREMSSKWPKIRALMGGTEALRQAGETYLPKHYAETNSRYKERLKCSVLKNYFQSTVDHMTGKVFSKPVVVEKSDSDLDKILNNADRLGSDITDFSSGIFQNALAVGLHFVLVDYPTTPQGMNLAQERQVNARPYFVSVKAEDVIGIKLSSDKTTIEEARIYEVSTEYTGRWSQTQVHRVRVLYPGGFELWKRIQKNDGDDWILETEGSMSINEVPLIPFYTKKIRPFYATPPLEDLADLNITHWQSYSDQRSILSVTRFPILGASGYDSEDDPEVEIGPFKLLATSDSQGKYYYIEHSGTAIEAGRKDLEDLKDEMAMFGIDIMLPQVAGGNATATQSQISNVNTSSKLQRMARGYESSMNEVLRITQKWRGKNDDIKCTLRGNFEMPRETTDEIQQLIVARQAGEISRPTFYKECQRRGFLSDDFDAIEEAELLDAEQPTGFSGFGDL